MTIGRIYVSTANRGSLNVRQIFMVRCRVFILGFI